MWNMAVDIGYSNLKVLHGRAGTPDPEARVFPAGAVPLAQARPDLNGQKPPATVLVDGEPWVAGLPQAGLLSPAARSLHKDYPSTPEYRALFHLALLQSGREHIEHLVTGLPVEHCFDEDRVRGLKARLAGVHEVAPGLKITVSKVSVGAQPAGSLLAASARPDLRPLIDGGLVTVVDPGFFSLDWLTLEQGRVVRELSGTSMRAVSVVFERLAEHIRQTCRHRVTREMLEHAVRTGAPTILVAGQPFDFWPFLEAVSREVGRESLRALVNQLRVDDRGPDLVVLTGGGASLYEAALREMLPDSRVALLGRAVLANAEGFWTCAS